MNSSNYIILFFLIGGLMLSACEGVVEDLNDNPNDITLEDVDAQLFLTGAMLGNVQAQVGHLNRISGMYSGQLVGLSSLYSNIYGFSLSTAESVGIWGHIYVAGVANLRHLRSVAPNDQLLVGIAQVVEAHGLSTAANLFGDVPFTEINNPDIPNPRFDGQVFVFNAMLDQLDEAITNLSAATSRSLPQDIYYGGDRDKWMEAAYTLRARIYLHMRMYTEAYASAQNGISSASNSMLYIPRGDVNIAEGDKNLFWMILEGARAGDIGTSNSYLMQILNQDSVITRANAKTDESARLAYYTIDETGGRANLGVIEQFEPQPMITFEENTLILAECGARTIDDATGLGHLNDLRAWLNTGGRINANFLDSSFRYDPYELADFQAGGIENQDGIAPERALLREIIEERYVSGFGSYMPYDDARRLRTQDSDIAVPYFLVDGPNPPFPERMPYSDDELNSNTNAPAEDPGIFTRTEVNQ